MANNFVDYIVQADDGRTFVVSARNPTHAARKVMLATFGRVEIVKISRK